MVKTIETKLDTNNTAKTANSRFFISTGPDSPQHVLAANQFDPTYLKILFDHVDTLRELDSTLEGRQHLVERHKGRQLCTLFYEPSTRTRMSFEAAAAKLGMGIVSTENAGEFSSAAKGETIEDTIKVLNEYNFDAVVLRHNETGAAARAAVVSKVPILNAGDGKGEHPTQALLDTYTIHQHFGKLSGLEVVMGGDLKNGRTVRSLAQMLAKYHGNRFAFVSIPELQMNHDIKQMLKQNRTTFRETENLEEAFKNADVVYWTRLQKERIENPGVLANKSFVITRELAESLPDRAIILHPLPRVDEIEVSVDENKRATYFQQAGNGLYIRMALLDLIMQTK